ncbi:hypothetical protein Ddye_027265 [Dipteronia dyeriana]|uniref:Disease resistance protein At4g27190-like leucine-rich repeats domain-containing protein n=1 Tax=Dipteronia dyeriana TaxID=168575 RepID=A0AAD9TNS6_9ROSI|nr:hypothetical protein Ddye_027265 [Dipteronia dyeriana]
MSAQPKKKKGIPFLDSEDLTWISRLRKFHFFIGPTAKTLPTKLEERSVRITDLELSQKQIVWFLINATSVLISGCWELNKLLENFIKDRVHCVSGLKSLTISSCVAGSRPRTFPHPLSMSGSQKKLPVAQCDLLPNLEELHLHHLMHLKSISELAGHLGLKFSRLRILEVTHCAQIDHVLPYGDSMINTEMLEVIKIGFCDNLEEIFRYVPGQREAPFSVLPNLHIVELKYLQSLKTICKQEDSLQSLEQLEVINCGALRTLPLTDHNANTIKEIKGGIFWWNNLEWDNYNTKVCVQHFFKPASGDIRPETWRWFRTDPNVNSWMPTTLPTIRQGPLQYI